MYCINTKRLKQECGQNYFLGKTTVFFPDVYSFFFVPLFKNPLFLPKRPQEPGRETY